MSPGTTPSVSEPGATIRLVADAGDPMVEIFVIDPSMQRIAKSTGRLEIDLKAGIYKVKFKAGTLGGSVEDEKVVVVEPGRPLPIVEPSPGIAIASPVPIRRTRTSREYHRNPARELSRQTHKRLGSGSRLLVFVRDLDKGRADNALAGLTLHKLDSEEPLLELEKAGEIVRDASSGFRDGDEISAACSLDLAPGSYRLRIGNTPAGSFESPIVASKDWQTQVFLPRRSVVSEGQPEAVFADLQHASVLMARPDIGFEFDNPDLRLTEKARYALAELRPAVGRSAVNSMLQGKFENPMLGLYGAHILLLAPQPEEDLLDLVIGKLRTLIHDHPDLRALELWQAQRRNLSLDEFHFSRPPILKRGWHIIRSAAAVQEHIVPEGSILSHISGWEMCDTMWLTWAAEEVARSRRKEPWSLGAAPSRQLLSIFSGPQSIQAGAKSILDSVASTQDWERDFDPVERELIGHVSKSLRQSINEGGAALGMGYKQLSEFVRMGLNVSRDDEKLLRRIGIPKSSVKMAIDRLLRKLST